MCVCLCVSMCVGDVYRVRKNLPSFYLDRLSGRF